MPKKPTTTVIAQFDPSYIPPDVGSGFDWRCQRCGHLWRSTKPNSPKPRGCAKCRNAYWDKQPKNATKRTHTSKRVQVHVDMSAVLRQTKEMWTDVPRANVRTDGLSNTDDVDAAVNATVASTGASYGGISRLAIHDILPPPPHMQRALYRPSGAEPAPENLIRKPAPKPISNPAPNPESVYSTDGGDATPMSDGSVTRALEPIHFKHYSASVSGNIHKTDCRTTTETRAFPEFNEDHCTCGAVEFARKITENSSERILSERTLPEKLDDNLGTDQGTTETETLPAQTTNISSPSTDTEKTT